MKMGAEPILQFSTPDTDTYGSSGFVRSLETNSAATAPTAAPTARSTVRDILVRGSVLQNFGQNVWQSEMAQTDSFNPL